MSQIADRIREQYSAERRVLSFDDFLGLFQSDPWAYSRDASRYLKDCFEYFGQYPVKQPWGTVQRFALFDDLNDPAEKPDRRARLVGNEDAQNAFYRVLCNFSREGCANRLLLFHGPNGSAKSTFADCVMQGLEKYSREDAGALYTFSWIFPRGQDGKTIGFGSKDALAQNAQTFAHLEDDAIAVKLRSELRESPLLLLPKNERQKLINQVYKEHDIEDNAPQWIRDGELSHKNQQVYQALLTSYQGDLGRVLAHVRVERYQISRRYRIGAVTIGPQMSVDARERQITADQSVASLPASLSATNLFETFGDLVDASGGLLEYSDLLKRPLEAWKYLLLAIEEGEVPLSMSNLTINSVFVASSNELHLAAFREHPEYNSFRVRLEPIRMPYLLDYTLEERIYESQILPHLSCNVAPHAVRLAAIWSVLTRLRRAQESRYADPKLGKVAATLSPMEKADLYAKGHIPERLSQAESGTLKSGLADIRAESSSLVPYEGLSGASPRELRTLLLDAAQDARYDHLSPLAVLDQIERLCIRGDHVFLKETAENGYQDHRGFISQVKKRWLEYVEDEMRSCSGLVEEKQYAEMFDRYITHVSYSLKNERVFNKRTGSYEEPDEALMNEVEKTLDVSDDKTKFRKALISSVGAHALDNPGAQVDYARLFPEHIKKLRQAFFTQRQVQMREIAQDILALLSSQDSAIDQDRRLLAQNAIEALKTRFLYTDSSLRVALAELVSQ
ncbi:MAG: serine protein kinase PrkA [Myxococcales bacterium]|nr:MAG: serine protein kinase PrkA [Myxococcales bacterium]